MLVELSRSLDHCDSHFWHKNAKICLTAVQETPLSNRKLGSCVINFSNEARTSVNATAESLQSTLQTSTNQPHFQTTLGLSQQFQKNPCGRSNVTGLFQDGGIVQSIARDFHVTQVRQNELEVLGTPLLIYEEGSTWMPLFPETVSHFNKAHLFSKTHKS